MATAFRNAVDMLGVSIAEASHMASRNPAQFLGLGDELGRIAPGYRADLVLMDDDFTVRETWIGGVSTAERVAPSQETPRRSGAGHA
jgi:N-acetylglucosamine-6-phosphate deacetylase